MPNINDLQKFIKADNVYEGDIMHFCDAGTIAPKEFEDKQTKVKKVQDVLEMEVMINDEMKKKIYSPNAISRALLSEAWGPDTENWVGRTGVVSLVEQLSFGKLTKVLIVKPYTPKVARPQSPLRDPMPQGTDDIKRNAKAAVAAGTNANVGLINNSEDIEFNP